MEVQPQLVPNEMDGYSAVQGEALPAYPGELMVTLSRRSRLHCATYCSARADCAAFIPEDQSTDSVICKLFRKAEAPADLTNSLVYQKKDGPCFNV